MKLQNFKTHLLLLISIFEFQARIFTNWSNVINKIQSQSQNANQGKIIIKENRYFV